MINIQQVIAEENIFTGDSIGADYCHDECPGVTGTPDAAVEVTSTELSLDDFTTLRHVMEFLQRRPQAV